MSKYKIHCPRTKVVKLKIQGVVHTYTHGQEDVPFEDFFPRFKHIFHKQVETEIVEFTSPETKEGKGTLIDKLPESIPFKLEEVSMVTDPEPSNVMEILPNVETEPELAPLEIMRTAKKGWYIVVDPNNSNQQVFPEEGKKCRKKAADQFIKEQTNG